jgi:predicted alpha/beta-fold hydrolase
LSAPHDLQAGAEALSRGFSRVYTWNFLRTLKVKSRAKLEQFPDLFDRNRMERSATFFDFDDAVTAPLHGFSSCYDYWQRSSSRQFMATIEVPTLVLNALNDPFVPPASLATPAQVADCVTLAYPQTGGHVGFVSGSPPGSLKAISDQLLDWFAQDLT